FGHGGFLSTEFGGRVLPTPSVSRKPAVDASKIRGLDQQPSPGASPQARPCPTMREMSTPTFTPADLTSLAADSPLAVLASGGLDSAILLGEALHQQRTVHPLYVRCGLFWEETELHHLRQFLAALPARFLRPLHVLSMPVADLLEAHWSLTGQGVPGPNTPDE